MPSSIFIVAFTSWLAFTAMWMAKLCSSIFCKNFFSLDSRCAFWEIILCRWVLVLRRSLQVSYGVEEHSHFVGNLLLLAHSRTRFAVSYNENIKPLPEIMSYFLSVAKFNKTYQRYTEQINRHLCRIAYETQKNTLTFLNTKIGFDGFLSLCCKYSYFSSYIIKH